MWNCWINRRIKANKVTKERLQSKISLLVVKNFQSVDLPFSLDCNILIFATEYSRYHLKGLNLNKTFALSFDLPVKATIQQQNSCFGPRHTSQGKSSVVLVMFFVCYILSLKKKKTPVILQFK